MSPDKSSELVLVSNPEHDEVREILHNNDTLYEAIHKAPVEQAPLLFSESRPAEVQVGTLDYTATAARIVQNPKEAMRLPEEIGAGVVHLRAHELEAIVGGDYALAA